jgi:hypothetical protein
MTREDAGYAIRASQSKMSRLELGRVGFKERDVADLLTLYEVDEQERAGLLSLARQANAQHWWHVYSDILPSWFELYVALEEVAVRIRTYELQFIPNLLQTEEYARAAIAVAGPAILGQQTVEEALALVLARQEAVGRDSGIVLWAVIDESVLMRSIVGQHVQLRQLDMLIDHAKRPNVSLHVVPMDDPAYVPRTGPFTLWRFAEAFEPDIACAHGIESEELITDTAAVEAYHQAFTKLSVTTTTRDETFEVLNYHRERLSRSLGK